MICEKPKSCCFKAVFTVPLFQSNSVGSLLHSYSNLQLEIEEEYDVFDVASIPSEGVRTSFLWRKRDPGNEVEVTMRLVASCS